MTNRFWIHVARLLSMGSSRHSETFPRELPGDFGRYAARAAAALAARQALAIACATIIAELLAVAAAWLAQIIDAQLPSPTLLLIAATAGLALHAVLLSLVAVIERHRPSLPRSLQSPEGLRSHLGRVVLTATAGVPLAATPERREAVLMGVLGGGKDDIYLIEALADAVASDRAIRRPLLQELDRVYGLEPDDQLALAGLLNLAGVGAATLLMLGLLQ